VAPREQHRLRHVGGVRGLDDDGREAVDRDIPDRAGGVVALVARQDDGAGYGLLQLLQRLLVGLDDRLVGCVTVDDRECHCSAPLLSFDEPASIASSPAAQERWRLQVPKSTFPLAQPKPNHVVRNS
jgi:hypothetical protein